MLISLDKKNDQTQSQITRKKFFGNANTENFSEK